MSHNEKRSIERHSLEEIIHIDGGDGEITGRTIDISRNGMRVVVDNHHVFNGNKAVSVSLSGTRGLGIPCHIRRSREWAGQWEFGLEFDGETEARMLLIERWLQSIEKHQSIRESAPTESRQVPRTRCAINDIWSIDGKVKLLSVDDISLDGMLLRAENAVGVGSILQLAMKLNNSNREIRFTGRVAYSLASSGESSAVLGVAVESMKDVDRNRLRSFIVEIASGAAMLEFHRLLKREEPGEDFRITELEAAEYIRGLASEGKTINVLDEKVLKILETRIQSCDDNSFSIEDFSGENGVATFFSFMRHGSSYSFSTKQIAKKGSLSSYKMPKVIYRGEKRAGSRRSTEGSIVLQFGQWEKDEAKEQQSKIEIVGVLVDSSRRGMLCEIPDRSQNGIAIEPGMPVTLVHLGQVIPGEVRHLNESVDIAGQPIIYIGIETGIQREEPVRIRYSGQSWRRKWSGPQRALKNRELLKPRPVRYVDRSGREIVGLLNVYRPSEDSRAPLTAVVIPPAFGKKKETLAPLALTLLTHFAEAGESVAVLRYDGIDKPGESSNANSYARRGYEMLGYRIDQGYADLEASMAWVHNNDALRPEKIVLLSFSMAALDARRLQASQNAGIVKADYWISVMGVSSTQRTLCNILGGLDVIAHHRMGLPIGTLGMLGQLIDMDQMASDMTRLGYAVLSDARHDMSCIESPVTWIFGQNDKWMLPDEIDDVMSIAAPGDREIVEVPTGHNLRTSDDALSVFQMISDGILKRIRHRDVPSMSPDKNELFKMITLERERVTETGSLDTRRYWKGYLVGETADGEGYDFYDKLIEFREFLAAEVDLLDPKPGQSIADFGCGTGLVSQTILRRLAEKNIPLNGTRFVGVDLIDEALDKAAEKYHRLSKKYEFLTGIDVEWIAQDLEPDPLAPVRRYLGDADPVPKTNLVRTLENRIKGLTVETVDRLSNVPGNLINPIICGGRQIDAAAKKLESMISQDDQSVMMDLNRAALFILGDLDEEDLKTSRSQGKGPINQERLAKLRTSDILATVLEWGDAPREGSLPFEDGEFDSICASLLLSYFFAPEEAVKEFFRMLKPRGRLVLSSMVPDSDISGIFTRYIADQVSLDAKGAQEEERERNLREARAMLNEAAALFTLEEDGWFHFFDSRELIDMLRAQGFTNIRSVDSLGHPAQAVIVTGIKK